jgi:hypothetical protein
MAYEKRVATLIVILAVVFALIGFNLTQDIDSSSSFVNQTSQEIKYIETTANVSVSGTRNLVSDRFSKSSVDEGQIIVIGSDGSKYVVQKGTVLVDDKVIRVTEEEASVIVLEDRN